MDHRPAHPHDPGPPGPDPAEAAEDPEGPGLSAPPTTRRFTPAPFSPGRYANTLLRTTDATHALQHIREEMESSFVLELAADGGATLCRSWRYLASNSGPQLQTREHLREQLGYRGRWRQAGEEVHVELDRDNAVCPWVGEYTELVPRHVDRWELVCHPVRAVVAGRGPGLEGTGVHHPRLEGPMLLCSSPFMAPRFGEDEPHLVGGVLLEGDGRDPGPHRWIVLGAGKGVRIRVERDSVEATGEERVQMEPGEGAGD